ncbi:hypothetical protein FB567DRAFT_161335 [Paraphoma chrysanthemicola]|uniref:Uncharacterized protein n=1 Tax=Paraphoma chrysanthemicola TaxID=798071 RepID=A0A8K0W2R6_9PLEO|nr:hypothetical protein FB567DRAFT_161335 [Paraphoma chrysanthemicola]
MTATTSTAIACATTTMPSRRISWKDEIDAQNVPVPFSDENANANPVSENPFSGIHHASTSPQPNHPSKISSISDIEAQDSTALRRLRKARLRDYLAIFCMFLVWFLFVLGAYMLMETVFPGSLCPIRRVRMDLGRTVERVDMLKTQVGELYRYVGSLKMGDVVGLSWGNETMGAVEANANQTVDM